MIKPHELSARAACRTLNLSRSVYGYRAKPNKNDEVIEALQDLAERRLAYGFWIDVCDVAQRGQAVGPHKVSLSGIQARTDKLTAYKCVYRIYKALHLHMRRQGKKRLPNRSPIPLLWPE